MLRAVANARMKCRRPQRLRRYRSMGGRSALGRSPCLAASSASDPGGRTAVAAPAGCAQPAVVLHRPVTRLSQSRSWHPSGCMALSCTGQLSRGDCTIRAVVRYNCCVTDVPDDADGLAPGSTGQPPGGLPAAHAPDGTELERLLAQLIRLIGPALGDGAAAPGAPSQLPDQVPAVSPSEARALIELMTARGIAQGELGGLRS